MSTLAPVNVRDFPPVEENIERPDTLSQTLMEAHDTCPRRAYLSRKYKGGPGSIEMDRGIAIHETIERCERMMLDEDERTIPGEVARDMAEAVMAERTDLVLPAAEQDRVRAMAWNWAESPQGTIDPDTLIGVEVPMEFEVGGFPLTCRLDRLESANDNLYVTDYKSGFPGRREYTLQSFQGKFYGVALLWGLHRDTGHSFGANITDVWFHETFPRIRQDDGSLVVYEAVWSRTELFEFKATLERNVAGFAEALETGLWPARSGSWCSRCPADAECPIPGHLREVESISTAQEARDAFEHKMALERESRRIQAGMRGWVQENSAIFVGDYAFDGRTSQSREVKDWPTFEEAVRNSVVLGEPLDLGEHVRDKTSTKFAKRKLTEEELLHGRQG